MIGLTPRHVTVQLSRDAREPVIDVELPEHGHPSDVAYIFVNDITHLVDHRM